MSVEAASSEYDYGSHWISEQLNSGVFGIENPILVSVVKFGLVWDLLAAAYTVLRWSTMSTPFLIASALGLLWVNLGPFLIWYYDERVLPRFFSRAHELLPSESERDHLAKKYTTFFSEHRLSVSLFWTLATVLIVYASRDVLQAQGMVGSARVFLWTTYLYALYIGSVLGHGFMGPVTTILLVRELSELDLTIDPLHPDNLGGLSNVGYCAIRTTLLFSTGSLFLPLLFRFVSRGASSVVIFGFTGVYILTILASFVYPTVKVNRRAQELRDRKLEELRQEYAEVRAEMGDPGSGELGELNRRLELQRVQNAFDKFNSVRLYPMQIDILTRLAGSLVLPLLFLLLEFYLPELL
ncbi:hypothetical protein [Haloplanus aerogenes]|uniref:Uncharacterized protein n=1 Tax=Haloplanus aerogenes TaxID=660522 RepID=A0A3M0D348_9EURY|nr:hypothetical protein [Haloplanus aerogenes]AZH25176.1 hypothetical protein DU502_07195 [Haloplanus aerogenes]RMB13596.1 hypothetical protein ATH50_2035 [Haloplanus aerogenes]